MLGSDEAYREWGYTALSRHRDSSTFYVTAPNDFLNDPSGPILGRDELVDFVARGFESERRQELAIEALEASAPTPPVPDVADHGFDMGM